MPREQSNNIFQTRCQISKVQTLADRGIQVKIETPEHDSEDIAKLFDLKDKEVWVAFKETEVKESDLEITGTESFDKGKSPSERLRAVMYRYFEQNYKKLSYKHIEQFEIFYKMRMEKHINNYKDELD